MRTQSGRAPGGRGKRAPAGWIRDALGRWHDRDERATCSTSRRRFALAAPAAEPLAQGTVQAVGRGPKIRTGTVLGADPVHVVIRSS
jgi:hypothetical protein